VDSQSSENGFVRPVFEILEHTADLGFRATGSTLAELFENAAEALVAIALNPENVEARETIALEAKGESREALLVNWLSEVLYWIDGEHRAMRGFKVRELTAGRVAAEAQEFRVAGEAQGERRDPARHEPRLVVKGITYHQLKIEHSEQGWQCEVYLDI
jgi:SHS2 domain-containing protein